MKTLLVPLALLVGVVSLSPASAATGITSDRLPDAGATSAYHYHYGVERAEPAATADMKGPYAYLFERDVRISPKAAVDGGPYAYLFAYRSQDRG